ncbi:hypothetical protein [Luteimonas sp. e5]
MHWDVFTIIQQLLIILTIVGQIWISFLVIKNAKGNEQYVRLMSFCTGLLLFLLCRPLDITFADMMLRAHEQGNILHKILIGGVMPFLVGIFVSEGTVLALHMRKPIPIRFMLIVAAFTLSQAAYTNYIALITKVTTLDKAFIPNICYAIAVGAWMTWRYRELPGHSTSNE